jgi:hypothetical protein
VADTQLLSCKDGVTGGFNFQHAWTSSVIAADAAAARFLASS